MRETVSILIPTHDRCDILARTLDSLASVRVPQALEVELIVVANACTDRTEAVVGEKARAMPFATRCVAEPRAGLNVARNRGVRESRGRVLALLDDDVRVDPGWLAALLDTYQTYPADLVGGRVTLWWEAVGRPDWMDDRLTVLLSDNDHGGQVREFAGPGGAIGANFSFRREVFDAVGGFRPGLDRVGRSLLSGGESDFYLRAMRRGFRLFYAPRASVEHWVAPGRVSVGYLSRVAFGNGRSVTFLREPFGWRAAGRNLLGRPPLLAWQALRWAAAWAGADRRSAVRRRLDALFNAGALLATLQRLAGRSPLQ